MKKTTLFSLLTMLLFFVGGNVWADTYTHTFVTSDIPEGTTDTEFTLSDVSWTLTMDGGKVSVFSNDLGAHFGTNNATCNSVKLSTEGIPGTIANVTVEASRGKNLVGTMAVTVGGTEYSLSDGSTTTALTDVSAAYDFAGNASGEIAIVWTKDAESTTSKGAFYIKKITIEYSEGGGVIIAKPVITPNGGTFTEPQTVTITAGEGCTIFYTLDGTEPASTHSKYEAPFTVSESCTVKAVAYDVTGAHSGIAEAVFKFAQTYTSIAALCADATSTKTSVLVEFNNWICTGVKSSNAYFTDGKNGILLYEKNNGFEVGDQLSGSAQIGLTIYNECAEITGLTSTTEGLTVTKGATATPITVSVAELEKNMQGCVITVENVTYNATDKVFVDADDNKITPYGSFITLPELQDGAVYNATGVAIWFVKSGSGYWEIAPRTADEFALSSSVVVAKPVINPAGGTFAEPQQVTITAGEGCTIYYTTDGTDPGVSPVATGPVGTKYTAPFTVRTDCTVKAIAYDAEGNASSIASAEFTFITATAISTIAELCAAAPAEGEVEVLVEFNNWIVTGVNGGQVFFTDGRNGIVNYIKNHGFEVGDVVTGSAVVTLTTYKECAEITSLTATTAGVTVTKGEGATPMNVVVADLEKDMQGCLIHLEEVTYSGGAFIDGDDNTITPYGTFVKLPELLEGKTYNVTGVAVWFVKEGSGYWEIAPRTAEEIQLVTSQFTPESSWMDVTGAPIESEVIVDFTGTVDAVFTTNSDGAVTYSSSDESVATINEKGIITLVGKGVTTITANVAETETYLADSKSFTLNVTKDGYADVIFTYNDEDIVGQGAPDTGAELTATRNDIVTLYANRAYAKPNDTHIKIYGSKFEGKDEDKTLTEPSYLKLSVADGYSIVKIVMTATGDSNIKEWKDQYGTDVAIEGAVATWEGDWYEVTLTNQASAQARIKTIAVTYIDTSKVDAISTPTSVDGETAIYNLAGQRLSKMQKGINIARGKKILK